MDKRISKQDACTKGYIAYYAGLYLREYHKITQRRKAALLELLHKLIASLESPELQRRSKQMVKSIGGFGDGK